MAKLIQGKRIGRNARLRVGCSAVIFDPTKERILLTRRRDNGLWCLPGGAIDPGESASETCIREVLEETGLLVDVVRLIGIYSNPNTVVEYRDGNRYQLIALSFEAQVNGGELGTSDETSECTYFSYDQIRTLDLMENHMQRIDDALAHQAEAFIR